MSEAQVALVTGVSSGIGRAIATTLAAKGYRVFGTLRSKSAEPPPDVERLVLDVRDDASVRAAIAELIERAGRIDVVVNNAGASLLGAIEETDIAEAQALFDVNFFGAVRVTREVLPHLRARGGGRIVFVSSVVGFLPAPFMGFYAASKHAIEGYAESLDHEVRTLGIKVALVEPGFMRTAIDRNAASARGAIDAYAAMRKQAASGINAKVEAGDDPQMVADAVLRALAARRPRLRYPVGKGSGMLAALRSFLPARTFDQSFRKQFGLPRAS